MPSAWALPNAGFDTVAELTSYINIEVADDEEAAPSDASLLLENDALAFWVCEPVCCDAPPSMSSSESLPYDRIKSIPAPIFILRRYNVTNGD